MISSILGIREENINQQLFLQTTEVVYHYNDFAYDDRTLILPIEYFEHPERITEYLESIQE